MASTSNSMCKAVQTDVTSTCDSCETDSASEEISSQFQCSVKNDMGKDKKIEVGQCQEIPEVEVLHMEEGTVSRHVEIFKNDTVKIESDVKIVKYIPSSGISKCKAVNSDVSERSSKRQRGQKYGNGRKD